MRPHPLSLVAVVSLATLLTACDSPVSSDVARAVPPAPSFDKGGTQTHFNDKFEFTDVAFPDGTTGTIRAGSKLTNGAQDTDCEYYTPSDDYLGMFETQDFSSDDAEVIRQFCLDHYGDRTL